jgi:hypothetical protein
MFRAISVLWLTLSISAVLPAAEFQGLVVDWKCAAKMVQDGREKTFRQDQHCSLMKKYQRPVYGLITDDKKFYRLADPGNRRILELLRNTPDKDNLKVVVTGEISGDTIRLTNITML